MSDVLGLNETETLFFADLIQEVQPMWFEQQEIFHKIKHFLRNSVISTVFVIINLIRMYYIKIVMSKELKIPFRMKRTLFHDHLTLLKNTCFEMDDCIVSSTLTISKSYSNDYCLIIRRKCWSVSKPVNYKMIYSLKIFTDKQEKYIQFETLWPNKKKQDLKCCISEIKIVLIEEFWKSDSKINFAMHVQPKVILKTK